MPPVKFPARILLVDDNADMRAYVQRLLKDRWDVEVAEDGAAALEMIRRRRPDLVLSDIMMPRLDGFGLVKAIREDPALRDLPVILLSARAGEEAQVEGLDAGANDYLVKPFSAREMIGRISANLDVARIRRENTEALKRRTEQYETLLNAAPIGAFLVDADFRIREVNPAARPAFGDIPDMIGRDLDDVIHIQWEKPYADEIVRVFRHTLETGESHVEAERVERRADRRELEYYEWQIHRILLPEGGFGVVCYFRDIAAQVKARQRQRLMIDELNHRVKNTLATIQSIAMQTLRTASSTRDARTSLESRLVALSKAHDVLTREHWERANVQEIVQTSVAAYGAASADSRFDIDGAEVFVQPKAALALSLALHELATNAVKYGALSNATGRIALMWKIFDNQFTLQWRESGGPPVILPQTQGFGSRLIQKGVAQDLGGTAQLDFAPAGVAFALTVPLEEMVKFEKRERQVVTA
jgi:PAS domain S-box-containing protein